MISAYACGLNMAECFVWVFDRSGINLNSLGV